MNKHNQERLKKECECEVLMHFFDAYQEVMGITLEIVEPSERPDFICKRENGELIGIEIVKITRGDPYLIQHKLVVEKQEYMLPDEALSLLQQEAMKKDLKRVEETWRYSDRAILLIELSDIPLSEIHRFVNQKDLPDLYDTGFLEIWIVDTTGLQAFDNVELFCVKSEERHGYYPRGLQKPYG